AGSAVAEDGEAEDGGEARPARRRSLAGSRPRAGESYADVLSEAVTRLDQRDAKHQAALTLLLGEIDRLPDAEAIWLFATSRIAALKRFPWSPLVLREAEGRLLRRSALEAMTPYARHGNATHGTMNDALHAVRADAVLYADSARRSALLAEMTKNGALEPFLLA